MTETYVAGFSEAFRIVPKYPGFAVSASGHVFNLNAHRMVIVDEEGFAGQEIHGRAHPSPNPIR